MKRLSTAADSVCAGALDTIRHQMKRPLVVLVRYPEDTRLDAWLARQKARKLASSTTEGAWLISADAVVAQR